MITLQTLPALVLWTVVVIRLLGLRFGWKPGVMFAAGWVALAQTLNIDQIYLAVDGLLGGWNLLNLIVHLLIGAGMTELSRLLLQATGRSSRRMNAVLVGMGLALGLVQVLLLAASDTQGSATNFTDTFADSATVALYQASFFGWVGLVFGFTGVECLRRDTRGESRAFGIGFNFVSMGCLGGVLTVVTKMVLILQAMLSSEAEPWLYIAYRVLVALTIISFSVGFILPSYERIRAAYASRRKRAQALDSLRPIVQRLAETPEGRHSLGSANIYMDARSSAKELYRWLIFIGDIRVLGPDLLSEREKAVVDKVGSGLDH